MLFLILGFGAELMASGRAQALDLPAPLYSLDGKVTTVDGTPLGGARVTLQNATGGAAGNATTDPDGLYRFERIAAGNYSVSAAHECCLRASVRASVGDLTLNHTAPDLALPERVPVQSGDPVHLAGVVRDRDNGTPLGNVFLEIESHYAPKTTTAGCAASACAIPEGQEHFGVETDLGGAFDLDVNRGWVHLSASRDGYDFTYASFQTTQDRSIEVPLQAGRDTTGRLFGVLRSSAGGAAAGGWVYASPLEPGAGGCPPEADCLYQPSRDLPTQDPEWRFEPRESRYGSAQAGPDGAWELRVAAATLRVYAHAPDHVETTTTLELEEGAERRVDLALLRIPDDSVRIAGRVTDSGTGDPIPGAQIAVENQQWGTAAWGRSDGSGAYSVWTKPGYSILTVSARKGHACPEPVVLVAHVAADDTPAASYVRPSPCKPDENSQGFFGRAHSFLAVEGDQVELDFNLRARPPPSGTFQGYVLNGSSGTGVPNAVVTFHNEATQDWGTARTDEHGSYRIQVHAGYYSIRVWAEGYYDDVANADIDAKNPQRLDFKLSPGHKRHGGWAMGGYAVAEATPGPRAEPTMMAGGPPRPASGEEAYHGEPGGMGPYRPSSAGHSVPAPTPLAIWVAFGLAASVLLRRRS